MQINNHRLTGEGVSWQPSPNHGGPFDEGLPDCIVLHYTGGSSLQSSADHLCEPETSASAHLVVGRDGQVIQLVPFDTVAWHAGDSSYAGRHGYNRYAIGIEMDNAGPLTRNGNHYTAWFGRQYAREEVVEAVHRNGGPSRFWHAYTEAQIARVREICRLLIGTYTINSILGHEEIAPQRKIDPGPAFPLDKFRQSLLASSRAGEGKAQTTRLGMVEASYLNLRSEPSVSAITVAQPLPRGTLLDVIEERDGWCRVDVRMEGWVMKKYIKV